ncbi:MacB family efflux pump subunit [Curvibacter sp. CHRR-16]|uniref:MacB family efflux pump subunit n=1 Tax=Curvibacter sp. CHRR-16 TaxID=2835872 RepID=UPI001BD9A929|nr:MacB family efflux pump subunit [Curvibacter sp. CHRR-16]MBT0571634.1 MacB family efflux pump subunit [Curvibacter sp. CHRR-16]
MSDLLVLSDLWREFPAGDSTVAVLREVNLTIRAGEMVAIMGPSGSGKSTLMNILGCLDKPNRGTYRVAGKNTADMQPDELAQLRREYFGFIFQRYQLLGDMTALGNVEMPAIYAGLSAPNRHARAKALLERLGLGERLGHRPGQLSGGQQQRVSIARALMNGGKVILADEPTGALDQASGREVMTILKELHAQGHTIILVTHDAHVAQHADRIIEIRDGRIVADQRKESSTTTATAIRTPDTSPPPAQGSAPRPWWQHWGNWWQSQALLEAAQMAVRAMLGHKLRTLLTMLGIIIGIASVVSVVGLGEGSKQKVLSNISSLGTNTISIMPGKGFGDRTAGRIRTLRNRDAIAIRQLDYVDSVTPVVTISSGLRYRDTDVSASISGVGEDFFRVRGYTLEQGQGFSTESVRRQMLEAVIDSNTYKSLFPYGDEALGQVIVVDTVPVVIVGVTAPKSSPMGNDDSLNIWVPYTTAMSRMTGRDYLSSITVRINSKASSAAAEQGIYDLLAQRHGKVDFFLMNSDSIRQTIEETSMTITLLISAIAFISLLVGGIGVMNIMLVSVTERTGEIGIRMAVGARQSDILRQFLIEATLVCIIGGTMGLLLALGAGLAFAYFSSNNFSMVISTTAVAGALGVSTAIGMIFGLLPARSAAKLDPVEALARP